MAPTIFFHGINSLPIGKEGEKLPGEYAADEQGNPTSDPNLARSLLPIGTYKGYGLAAMGEILCGVLTGMLFWALYSCYVYFSNGSTETPWSILSVDAGRYLSIVV